jgi:hypothetical protein
MTSPRFCPSTYSRMRKYDPSSSLPKSFARAIAGWLTCAPTRASRSNRATISG